MQANSLNPSNKWKWFLFSFLCNDSGFLILLVIVGSNLILFLFSIYDDHAIDTALMLSLQASSHWQVLRWAPTNRNRSRHINCLLRLPLTVTSHHFTPIIAASDFWWHWYCWIHSSISHCHWERLEESSGSTFPFTWRLPRAWRNIGKSSRPAWMPERPISCDFLGWIGLSRIQSLFLFHDADTFGNTTVINDNTLRPDPNLFDILWIFHLKISYERGGGGGELYFTKKMVLSFVLRDTYAEKKRMVAGI